MAEKTSVFKKLFSKSSKDCCSVEIEEVKLDTNSSADGVDQKSDKQQKEV